MKLKWNRNSLIPNTLGQNSIICTLEVQVKDLMLKNASSLCSSYQLWWRIYVLCHRCSTDSGQQWWPISQWAGILHRRAALSASCLGGTSGPPSNTERKAKKTCNRRAVIQYSVLKNLLFLEHVKNTQKQHVLSAWHRLQTRVYTYTSNASSLNLALKCKLKFQSLFKSLSI